MVHRRATEWERLPLTPSPAAGLASAAQPTPAALTDVSFESDRTNPARQLAFYASLMLIFLRFSLLHQITTYFLHVNLYLLYLFGIPAMLGLVFSSGFRRTYQGGRPTYYWTAFALWLMLTVPFSSWRGGSLATVLSYWRTDFPMMFFLAGLTLTWKECRQVMGAAALGGVINVLSGKFFEYEQSGRLSLEFGSISNSNDYAAHLVLVVPFILWVALSPERAKLLRLAAFLGVAIGVYSIFKTASRGAVVALAVQFLVILWRGSPGLRLALFATVPILLALVVSFVPKEALVRIASFSGTDPNASAEALESSDSRRYLLETSIKYTFEFPIFGVGPGQFSTYEGMNNRVLGSHGSFHQTHNTFTQISSETGIPGLLLFLSGIGSSFFSLRKIQAQARRRPECRDIALATLCVSVALAGFCMAITFLSFGYFFYLPAMGGLVVAMARAARYEFQAREPLSI